MTVTQHDAASDARYWPVPILRAIPAIVLGLVITFVNNHSATLGLTMFGATTIAGGVIVAIGSLKWLDDSSSRNLALVQGVLGVIFGILALAVPGGRLQLLVALVTGWAVITGVIELVMGLRRRRRSGLARDWTIVGVLTMLLAVAYLVVPIDYSKELGGIEQIKGTLTSATILVGLVGAYGALLGVFLIVQGLSLKWQTSATPDSNPDPTLDGAHSS